MNSILTTDAGASIAIGADMMAIGLDMDSRQASDLKMAVMGAVVSQLKKEGLLDAYNELCAQDRKRVRR